MRVLCTVLTHAGQISLDVAGVVSRFVERRREQHDQPRIVTYEILVERLHCDPCSIRSPRSRDDAPALRHRIDLAFVARARSKRRAIVEVRATIPFTIPRRSLDRLRVLVGLRQHLVTHLRVTAPISVSRELPERRDQKPREPYTLTS